MLRASCLKLEINECGCYEAKIEEKIGELINTVLSLKVSTIPASVVSK